MVGDSSEPPTKILEIIMLFASFFHLTVFNNGLDGCAPVYSGEVLGNQKRVRVLK
jgi:hypothetical protein